MHRAAAGGDGVDLGAVGDINIFHRQGIEDFGGGSPADGVGQVVVTDEEEDGDTAGRQAVYAPGKLPLLGLARLTALIGIATEEDKVYLVFQGIVYHLVKGRQKIKEARG